MNRYQVMPYVIPFQFTDVAASTLNQVQTQVPHNVGVYAITLVRKPASANSPDAYSQFTLEILNYDTGEVLMDEPIHRFNLNADARLRFDLPAVWHIPKNTSLICRLNTTTRSTTPTYFIALLGMVEDPAPNPDKSPFIYSFPVQMGIENRNQASETAIQLSMSFNQNSTQALSKPMIEDFELHSFLIDQRWTTDVGLGQFYFSTQISVDDGRRLYNRPLYTGLAGGGAWISPGDAPAQAGYVGYEPGGIFSYIPYKLPQPEFIKKGRLVRVDILQNAASSLFDTTQEIPNQLVCVALIGVSYASR